MRLNEAEVRALVGVCKEDRLGYPLGQKLQLLLCGPEIFPTSVKMEFFNGIRRIADIWRRLSRFG